MNTQYRVDGKRVLAGDFLVAKVSTVPHAQNIALALNCHKDLLEACKLLLEIVRIQNGNLHEDTNKAQAIALSAIQKAEGAV